MGLLIHNTMQGIDTMEWEGWHGLNWEGTMTCYITATVAAASMALH
jgi:hypothetical protein